MKVMVIGTQVGCDTRELELPDELSVGDVLSAAGLRSELDRGPAVAVGIWGRVVGLDTTVRDGDRVELYLPLHGDPRRERQRRVLGGTTMGTGTARREP